MMQFSCTQENLNKGLFYTGHIASQSRTLPILSNILLKVENGLLYLISTDLEIGVKALVRGKAASDGEFTISSKLFSNYVNLLPKDKVNLKVDAGALQIECKDYKTKINGIDAADFPLIPEVPKKAGFMLPQGDLKRAINQVLFTVSLDEARPEISGALFSFQEKTLILTGTDSYRLAEKSLTLSQKTDLGPIAVIVPAKTVRELVRTLGDQGDIAVYLSENQILFVYGEVEMVSRLIEGQYPDYKQIIPQNWKSRALIHKEDMARAVKAGGLFTGTSSNSITLEFNPKSGEVKVLSASSHLGEEQGILKGEVEGDPLNIVFDYRYLLDGILNIEGDEIVLEASSSSSPALMKSKEKGEYLYIIMPIRQ